MKKQRETREKKVREESDIFYRSGVFGRPTFKPETGIKGNLGGKCDS